MNKTTRVLIGVVILAVIAGVTYFSMNKDETVVDSKIEESSLPVENKDSTISGGYADVTTDENVIVKSGSYETYAPEKLARAETGDVVLFFHASWCPTCRGLNSDIEKNLGAIPAEVSILKLNYDTETELKKKYGVTYQHTLVQVDANGTLIKKWSGSPTLTSLVSQIN